MVVCTPLCFYYNYTTAEDMSIHVSKAMLHRCYYGVPEHFGLTSVVPSKKRV